MGANTGISWTDRTWNPMVGCALVSPGCTNCYAMFDAHRIAMQGGKAGAKYAGLTKVVNGKPVWNGNVRLASDEVIDEPLRWGKPYLVFVNSMSDYAHEGLTDEEIFRVFDVAFRANRHVYQFLTKRHARAVDVVNRWLDARGLAEMPENFWMGFTIEDQKRMDERLPYLKALRAKVKWMSCEPLIGAVDVRPALAAGVSWIVVGGESISWEARAAGEHARVFDIAWARDMLAACRDYGAAFHFKQLGENPRGATRRTPKGKEPDEWPEDLRVQEYPKEIAWLRPQANLPLDMPSSTAPVRAAE